MSRRVATRGSSVGQEEAESNLKRMQQAETLLGSSAELSRTSLMNSNELK